MSHMTGRVPAQKSVTAIHAWVPRCVALAVPFAASIALVVGGRDFAQALLLWGAVVLLFIGISALLAYMLTAGQFPPRLSKEGVELPTEGIDDTGDAIKLMRDTLDELVDQVERVKRHVGLKEPRSHT